MKNDKNKKDTQNDKIISISDKKTSEKESAEKKENNFSLKRALFYGGFIIVFIFIVLNVINDNSFRDSGIINTEPVSLAGANNFDLDSYRTGYVVAKDGKISAYNTNNELQWEINGSKTKPTVKTNKKYVLVYYTEDKVAVVTNGKKTNYIKTDGNVQYGYVNSKGYCVLFTEESGLNNKIIVYDKNGKELYVRQNSDAHIPYALLSDNNKILLTIELISSNNRIIPQIKTVDIRDSNKILSELELNKESISGCFFYNNNDFVVVSENGLTSYNVYGRRKWKKNFNQKILRYSYNSSGMICLLLETDNVSGKGSDILFYTTRGTKKASFANDDKASFVDIGNNVAVIVEDRKLKTINTKGKIISSTDISYDVKKARMLSTKKAVLILTNSNEIRLMDK